MKNCPLKATKINTNITDHGLNHENYLSVEMSIVIVKFSNYIIQPISSVICIILYM